MAFNYSSTGRPPRSPSKSAKYYRDRLTAARHLRETTDLQNTIAEYRKREATAQLLSQPKPKAARRDADIPDPAGDTAPVCVEPLEPYVRTQSALVIKRLALYEQLCVKLRSMPKSKSRKMIKELTSPDKLKAQRVTTQLSKDLLLDRRSLASGPRKEDVRKPQFGRRAELIVEFLKRPENSYTLAGKKDTRTINKVKYQKVMLTEFLEVLHEKFVEEYPDSQVSVSKFTKVRAEHSYIRLVEFNTTRVCLCQKHQNFTLKLRAVGVLQQPDDVVRNSTLLEFTEKLENLPLPAMVVCEYWQKVDVTYGPPDDLTTIKKLRLEPDHRSRADFIKHMAEEFMTMRDHSMRAQQQHRAVRLLRESMPESECTVQMDFAENWLVSYDEEPQTVYYSKDPVTLHPAVIHYRMGGVTEHISVALVTDDRRHDAGAILAFMEVLCALIKRTQPQIKVVHYASDSPSSQYRNRYIFSILCKHHTLLGLSATWTYFEAGHGKGPCDGIGAAAKRNADLAVKRRYLIRDAAEFALRGNLQSATVDYICLPKEDVEAARRRIPELSCEKVVVGTMGFHAVIPITEGHSLAVRGTSCFKPCCWEEGKSLRGCDGWEQRVLFRDAAPAEVAAPVEVTVQAEVVAPAEVIVAAEEVAAEPTHAVPTYNIGEWVACTYENKWYLGKVVLTEHECGEYQVHFFEEIRRNQFRWPATTDSLDMFTEDMLMSVPEPTPLASSGRRADIFSLRDQDYQAIVTKFTG